VRAVAPILFAAAALIAGFLQPYTPARAITSSDDLFEAGIPWIEIELTEDSVDSLRTDSRGKVPARVTFNRRSTLDGEVRLKGQGTFRPIDQKPSFTLDFGDHSAMGKVHLNNSLDDATLLHEQLGANICDELGLPAPRATQARVTLNGRSLGLYVLKEGFTRRFLARHFRSDEGRLFERKLPPALREAAEEPDPERRWLRLQKVIDVDRFASFLAAEVLMCHWDGYATGGNNVRIYHDPASGRFHFLPAGLDQLFGNPRYPAVPDMTGLVARSFMETSEGRWLFAEHLRRVAARFDVRRHTGEMKEQAARIGPFLSWTGARETHGQTLELIERVRGRAEYLDRELTQYAALK
jgi:spore coat protein H